MFLTLCWHKTGEFTEEEFDNAHQQLLENNKLLNYLNRGKPSIHVYFKKVDDQIAIADSLGNFKKKINSIGHFETYFSTTDDLCNQFGTQLDLLYQIKSVKSSVWIGIIGIVLATALGVYYYYTIAGKAVDLSGQRYIATGLILFGSSVGAFLFGVVDVIKKLKKFYFVSERILAIISTVVVILIGWFTVVPPVTIYHLSGRVADRSQTIISGVELNIEGTDMLSFSDSDGHYRFTFLDYPKDSSFTVVTSHAQYEDLSLTVRFDSPEITKNIILSPVRHDSN